MNQEFFSTSEARKNLSDLVNQVKYQGKSFSLGRHGEIEAMLVPVQKATQTESKSKLKPLHERVAERRVHQNAGVDYASPLFVQLFKNLAEKYKLRLVVLFGSQARGRVKPDSDIDLAVSAYGGLSPQDEMALYQELIPFYDRDDIDIINLDRVHNITLRYNVFSDGKILFEKEVNSFKKMLIRAYFEYQDFKKYLERGDSLRQKRIDRLMNTTI